MLVWLDRVAFIFRNCIRRVHCFFRTCGVMVAMLSVLQMRISFLAAHVFITVKFTIMISTDRKSVV